MSTPTAETPVRQNDVGITINQHIMMTERLHPGSRGEMSSLLTEIVVTCKLIASKMQRAGIADILGKVNSSNATGDVQAKLDVISNETLLSRVLPTGLVCAIATEEEEVVARPDPGRRIGDYVIVTDPLDGSSNIDCAVPVGTIFGIYRRISANKDHRTPATEDDYLQPGKNLVCGGYVLYGTSVMLVYSTGDGVHGFTLDPSIGEFVLSHPNMKFPAVCKNYSVNEGNAAAWDAPVRNFIEYLKTPDKATNRPLGARYVGSLVSDFHRNLLYGGIFMYPADNKNKSGKLRLLYEAIPLSYIAQQAGGMGSDGTQNILDIKPQSIHQKVPFYVGNKKEVELARAFLQGQAPNGAATA